VLGRCLQAVPCRIGGIAAFWGPSGGPLASLLATSQGVDAPPSSGQGHPIFSSVNFCKHGSSGSVRFCAFSNPKVKSTEGH
jgi:hypothetical protein